MLGKILMILVILGLIYFLILPKFRTKNSKKNDKITQNFAECKICKTFTNIDEMAIINGEYICENCQKGKK